MKISAICTDIDGTLLDSRRELSPRTISTIKKVSQKMPVILASSRMPAAMRHLQHVLGILHHPLICYNGGYVIHYPDGAGSHKVLSSVTISGNATASIVDLAKGTGINISLYHKDEWYAPRLDYWTDREQRITKVNAMIMSAEEVLALWERNDEGAHKVMCMGPVEEINILEKDLCRLLGDAIHIYRSRPTYIEIAPKVISKASALNLVLNLLNISIQDTMAFGDNYNDIEMLQAAGIGIAVGNARPEVKAVADEITLNSVEDGVATSIEKYCE
jgi:hypothetical protein